jgi:hypothetical protein
VHPRAGRRRATRVSPVSTVRPSPAPLNPDRLHTPIGFAWSWLILGNAWFDLQLEAWILMTDGEASSAVPRPRWQRNVTAVVPLFTQASVQGSTRQHVLQQDPTPLLHYLAMIRSPECFGGDLPHLLPCRYTRYMLDQMLHCLASSFLSFVGFFFILFCLMGIVQEWGHL